ncbi:MAG: nuclear transport factor 2 family protein [Acidimicrobiales bacterium]
MTKGEDMSVEETQNVVSRYLEGHSTDVLAQDAVFTMMGSGEEFHGPEAIAAMLQRFYHGIFEARVEERNLVVTDGQAVLEADVVGRLREPLGDIAPSDVEVQVPLCVVYDIREGSIEAARVYLETDRLRQR